MWRSKDKNGKTLLLVLKLTKIEHANSPEIENLTKMEGEEEKGQSLYSDRKKKDDSNLEFDLTKN